MSRFETPQLLLTLLLRLLQLHLRLDPARVLALGRLGARRFDALPVVQLLLLLLLVDL